MSLLERKAVALRYVGEDAAPRTLGSGCGSLVDQIEALARKHGIPIRQDSLLTDLLSILQPGSNVPTVGHRIVAELLAFLYQTDIRFAQLHPSATEPMGRT